MCVAACDKDNCFSRIDTLVFYCIIVMVWDLPMPFVKMGNLICDTDDDVVGSFRLFCVFIFVHLHKKSMF